MTSHADARVDAAVPRLPRVEVPVAVAGRDRFYVHLAYVCAAIAIVGFAPTYWIPLLSGSLTVAPTLHLHALFFYGWLALFIAQARLVGSQRVARHRELGVFGVAVATGMCFVGTAAAVHSLRQGIAWGFGDAARAFSVVPLTGIAFFALLFTLALLNTRRLDVHKRLLVVATISLLQAAAGRVVLMALGAAPPTTPGVAPPPVAVTLLPGLLSNLPLLWAMIHDKRTLGRVHRVYWIWGGALVALQVLRIPISGTAAWATLADTVASLVP